MCALFLMGALTLIHEKFFRFIFEAPFVFINQGLNFFPFLDFLKQRQDPVLSLFVLLVYWGGLGASAGCVFFLIRRKDKDVG